MMDPSSQEWEMCPQKARRRGRRLGPGAHRCGPIGWTKLAIAVNDIGQAPKVEDLAQGEGAGYDEELAREVDTAIWGGAACSGDEASGSSHCRA
jgi:hypothetical protein